MTKLVGELLNVLENTLPVVIVTCISIVSIRIVYLIKYKRKFVLYEELLNLLFIIYLLVLFQIVTYQDVLSYGNNLTLFKELTRYSFGSSLFIKNVIGNILLFIPYGFFTSYYLKIDRKSTIFLLTLVMSFAIEGVQLLIGRCFDIDDILLNIIGGMIGYFIYYIINKITRNLSRRDITGFLVFVILMIIIVLLYMMI